MGPHPAQAGHLVLELGQLHLQASLARAGTPRKDVENYLGAGENGRLGELFEVAGLCGTQLVVEEDGVDLETLAQVRDFLRLPFADEVPRVRALAALHQAVQHHHAGRVGQRG